MAKARILHHGRPRLDLAADDAGQFHFDRGSGPAVLYVGSPKGDLAGFKEMDGTQQQLQQMLSELSQWLPDIAPASVQKASPQDASDDFIERIVREVMQNLQSK